MGQRWADTMEALNSPNAFSGPFLFCLYGIIIVGGYRGRLDVRRRPAALRRRCADFGLCRHGHMGPFGPVPDTI